MYSCSISFCCGLSREVECCFVPVGLVDNLLANMQQLKHRKGRCPLQGPGGGRPAPCCPDATDGMQHVRCVLMRLPWIVPKKLIGMVG